MMQRVTDVLELVEKMSADERLELICSVKRGYV